MQNGFSVLTLGKLSATDRNTIGTIMINGERTITKWHIVLVSISNRKILSQKQHHWRLKIKSVSHNSRAHEREQKDDMA